MDYSISNRFDQKKQTLNLQFEQFKLDFAEKFGRNPEGNLNNPPLNIQLFFYKKKEFRQTTYQYFYSLLPQLYLKYRTERQLINQSNQSEPRVAIVINPSFLEQYLLNPPLKRILRRQEGNVQPLDIFQERFKVKIEIKNRKRHVNVNSSFINRNKAHVVQIFPKNIRINYPGLEGVIYERPSRGKMSFQLENLAEQYNVSPNHFYEGPLAKNITLHHHKNEHQVVNPPKMNSTPLRPVAGRFRPISGTFSPPPRTNSGRYGGKSKKKKSTQKKKKKVSPKKKKD